MIRIDGKRVLLTGGTKGVGRGIALELARAGGQVLTCSRRPDEAATSLVRELKEIGGEHVVVAADVTRDEDLDLLVDTCSERFGGVDVVVHNAGAITHTPIEELTLDIWNTVLATNLTAAFRLIQKCLPTMPDGGSIVSIGSRSAQAGVPLRAHYTATKAGLVGLTRSLAKELGPRGIRVNVVAPGVIEPEEAPLPPAVVERYERLTALGRLGRPAEVAGAVLFLAADDSRYVTGETINVDGGI